MATRKTKTAEATTEVIQTYKGFDQNLACRGFQYEVGKSYTHEGDVAACSSGFHACEDPLDVFSYYPPAGSRFALVEQSGALSRHSDDSKVASSRITVKAEIGLPGIIKAAIEYRFTKAKPENTQTATGDWGAASATGALGAAMASGYEGRAMGSDGCMIALAERDADYNIVAVWAGIAGRDGIKPGVFYMLRDGQPVEV